MLYNAKFQEIIDKPTFVSSEVKSLIENLSLTVTHKYGVFVIQEMNPYYNLNQEIKDADLATEYEWQTNKFYTLDYQANCGCKTSYEVAYLITEIYKILKKNLESFSAHKFVLEGWLWNKDSDPDVDKAYGGIRFHCLRKFTQSYVSKNIESSPCAIMLDYS